MFGLESGRNAEYLRSRVRCQLDGHEPYTLVANAHATVFDSAKLQILFIARQQLDPTVVYRATSLGIQGSGLRPAVLACSEQ